MKIDENELYGERDMNLIRLLLLKIEGKSGKNVDPSLEKYPKRRILLHKFLLLDAGFAVGTVYPDSTAEDISDRVHISRITWQGYEFLDKVRTFGEI